MGTTSGAPCSSSRFAMAVISRSLASETRCRSEHPRGWTMTDKGGERSVYLDWAADLSPAHVPAKAERRWLGVQQKFTTDRAKGWQDLRENIEESRRALEELLHIPRANNIIFSTGTLGGLQMLTQAFRIKPEESILYPGDEIIVTDCEFPFLYELLHNRYCLKIASIRSCTSREQQKDA